MSLVVHDSGVTTPLEGNRGSRLLRGILDACVLALIAERDRYGYEIAAGMRDAGLDLVRDGTIYPLLARLEHRGQLESYLARSASGPRRRYYRITTAGWNELASATTTWAHISRAVTSVLNTVDQ